MRQVLRKAVMKRNALRIALLFVGVLLVGPSNANALIIGAGAPNSNCFPFGCNLGNPSTRYQQVYDANQFSGTIGINGLTFFKDNKSFGNFTNGTFNFELSVTSKPVNSLDTANFDNNVTGPILSFGSLLLSGGAASTFMVSLTPFMYDPNDGNLLVDIKIPGGTVGGTASFDAYSGNAGGIFSRAHDFGGGFAGYGLKTEFKEISTTPEPSTMILLGSGLVGLIGYRVRKAQA